MLAEKANDIYTVQLSNITLNNISRKVWFLHGILIHQFDLDQLLSVYKAYKDHQCVPPCYH